MAKNLKKEAEKNASEGKGFIAKVRSDKKYKAKVELIGYGIFIVVLIIYLNFSSSGSTKTANISTSTNSSNNTSELSSSDDSLLDIISDNYEYETEITMKIKAADATSNDDGEETEEDDLEAKTIRYAGKSYGENLVVTKISDDSEQTYYKVGDYYYQMVEDNGDTSSSNFELVNEEEIIFDYLDEEFTSLSGVKKYIDMASLEHVTNYSSGMIEEVYYLKVSDVIKSYQDDDTIEISVVMEDNVLTIEIDYSNLVKVLASEVSECTLKSVYTSIGSTDEFVVMTDDSAADNIDENISE